MASRPTPERTAEAVARACTGTADPDELLESVAAELEKAVPFDGSLWLGVDPATLLATAPGRITGMDEHSCAPFWHGEFHVQDVLLYRDLARQRVAVGSLQAATGGHPVRSTRYREHMVPQGYDDELRAVFRTGRKAWGILGLYRRKGRPAFDALDVAIVDAVSSTVALALLQFAAGASRWDAPGPTSPGLLLFGPDDQLLSANVEAHAWLDELARFGGLGTCGSGSARWDLTVGNLPNVAMPPALCALVFRARAVAQGHEPGPARLRLRGRNDRWIVLHGSCMAAASPGAATVAVVIEPAKSAEIAPIVIEAYALTARERDVLLGLARGLSTSEVAAGLFLSVHTVRDYVKSVFEKVGVNSRGELIAKLFAEHYSDALHASVLHAD